MATKTRPPSELHVEPTTSGRWVVCYEHRQLPLSDHLTASDAEASARRRAHTEGIRRVLVHDCYTRVHEVPTSS
jgi:hypothetical protein